MCVGGTLVSRLVLLLQMSTPTASVDVQKYVAKAMQTDKGRVFRGTHAHRYTYTYTETDDHDTHNVNTRMPNTCSGQTWWHVVSQSVYC